MKKELTITHRLALRGKDVEQLRDLAGRYLSIDASNTPAKELTERLSAAATKDPHLSRELGESPISLKPSFYLMIATLPNKGDIAQILAEFQHQESFERVPISSLQLYELEILAQYALHRAFEPENASVRSQLPPQSVTAAQIA